MENQRSNSLMSNGVLYMIVTIILVVMAITKKDLFVLNIAMISFAVMVLSISLSCLFYDLDKTTLPISVVAISFIILIPAAIIVFIVTFLYTFTNKLTRKQGGDNDD